MSLMILQKHSSKLFGSILLTALLVFVGLPLHLSAQYNLRGFQIPENKKSIEVPFTYQNGFIILDIIIQDAFPLKFLFDTGAEYTVLAEKSIADLLHFEYQRSFKIMGSDLEDPLIAYLSRNIKLSMGSHLEAKNEDILVLAENLFKFEVFAGTEIHGILGATSIRNMVVQIDYEKEKLIFHRSSTFKHKRNFTSVPIDIKRSKPFLTANFSAALGLGEEDVRLLLDTGANIPFLLRKDSLEMAGKTEDLLPGNIASGIGGDLYGFVGRSHLLEFEEFEFSGVITNYQVVSTDAVYPDFIRERNGIIGNPILSRFDLILDYVDEKLYLKPNRSYKSKFKFDKSGLQLVAGGNHMTSFFVYNVLPNSPAARAGIKKGDEVLTVNGMSTKLMTMAGISLRLQKKKGKRINMKVNRNGSIIKKVFHLEELL